MTTAIDWENWGVTQQASNNIAPVETGQNIDLWNNYGDYSHYAHYFDKSNNYDFGNYKENGFKILVMKIWTLNIVYRIFGKYLKNEITWLREMGRILIKKIQSTEMTVLFIINNVLLEHSQFLNYN